MHKGIEKPPYPNFEFQTLESKGQASFLDSSRAPDLKKHFSEQFRLSYFEQPSFQIGDLTTM